MYLMHFILAPVLEDLFCPWQNKRGPLYHIISNCVKKQIICFKIKRDTPSLCCLCFFLPHTSSCIENIPLSKTRLFWRFPEKSSLMRISINSNEYVIMRSFNSPKYIYHIFIKAHAGSLCLNYLVLKELQSINHDICFKCISGT